VKLYCISFISMCGQIKPLVLYFSVVGFIFIYFTHILVVSYVNYCISNFVTRALRIAYRPTSVYLDEGKDCEKKRQKSMKT